ncbi:hypothetical protein GVv1_10560 [Enterobacter pseudoroggenkampii]
MAMAHQPLRYAGNIYFAFNRSNIKNICADAIFDYFYDTNMLMNIMLSVKSVRSKTIQDKDN